MPQDSSDQTPATSLDAPRRRRRWTPPVAALAAAAMATLAGCGPDIGPGPAAASGASTAKASAASAAISKPAIIAAAPMPAAPACPQLEQPKCPVAPAAQRSPARCCCAHHRGRRHHYARREHIRDEAWRAEEHERSVYRRFEDVGPAPPCPRPCPGVVRPGWDLAGIDARGYLVWPGKVEY